jgi:hypothetical protein
MTQFFSEWRAAAKAASAAERALSEVYMRYFNDEGEEPTLGQIDAARRKRSTANDLFWVAMRDARRSWKPVNG